MKQDLKVLAEHIEKKVGKTHVFHKMWDVLKGKEKPSRQTLDKLALLAGFQSWDESIYQYTRIYNNRYGYCSNRCRTKYNTRSNFNIWI